MKMSMPAGPGWLHNVKKFHTFDHQYMLSRGMKPLLLRANSDEGGRIRWIAVIIWKLLAVLAIVIILYLRYAYLTTLPDETGSNVNLLSLFENILLSTDQLVNRVWMSILMTNWSRNVNCVFLLASIWENKMVYFLKGDMEFYYKPWRNKLRCRFDCYSYKISIFLVQKRTIWELIKLYTQGQTKTPTTSRPAPAAPGEI